MRIQFRGNDKRLAYNMPELIPLTDRDKEKLAEGMGAIARKYGLHLQTCGTSENYSRYGISVFGCMTTANLGNALGCRFKNMAHKGTRIGCSCMPTRDIGAYNTCLNGCRYCYANKKPELAVENHKLHDSTSSLLIGHVKLTDIIKEGNQKSFII
nr:DUF1848 family protein [uncultured Phocaeicola sp.]